MKKYLSMALTLLVLMFGARFLVDMDPEAGLGDNSDQLEVHFIDVGQGDATLIKKGDKSLLIDGGDNGKEEILLDYLKSQGIRKLDYIIATHPHADHIGGLKEVVEEFSVDKIIMPDAVHTTRTFEDLIDAIRDKDLKITRAVSGDHYELNGAYFTLLAPNREEYDNLNNYSVVVRLVNGRNSYLLMGDAEALSEREILEAYGSSIRSDVLKLGHHGSSTSTHAEFFQTVDPSYGVISLGEDNKYGHPHEEIRQLLEESEIISYRTDLHGHIVSISDGDRINFRKSK